LNAPVRSLGAALRAASRRSGFDTRDLIEAKALLEQLG
jgi:hypothetical protein